MPDASLVKLLRYLISPLIAMARVVQHYFRRLYKERQAGLALFPSGELRLIDVEIDRTLARLRGEEVDDTLLSQLKTFVEHPLVTPQFLREVEIKDWLSDDRVRTDLKTLASARIMGASADDNEVKGRLRTAYASVSKKEKPFADEAIDVVVHILVAGYKASIPGHSVPVAGMIQTAAKDSREGFEETGERLDIIVEKLDALRPDRFVVAAHTREASESLSQILKRRGLEVGRAREEIGVLVKRVTTGDLCHAEQTVRAEVLYWAARLHASDGECLVLAKSYLDQLRQLSPGDDVRAIDALIMEKEGNVDSALQVLRDINNADGHSTLQTVLYRTRGNEAAIRWFQEQPGHEAPRFLTGLGWSNLAVGLAEMNRWEEAAAYLRGAQEHLQEWPDLAFIEGVINAAMLLPVELRHLALRMELFHPIIQTIKDPDVDRCRARAYECFDRAEKLMTAIGEVKRAQAAKGWLLWLRLTDEKVEVREAARKEVREAMKDGAQAVGCLLFALPFGIDFDEAPLQRYLVQRRQMGGLDGQEVLAEVLLAETTMTPHERADFLEREERRLAKEVPIPFLAGKRIEALLADGQIARARHVLEGHKSDFVEYDYDRLSAIIVKREGGDVRTKLEEIYSQTGQLLDLQNLVGEIGQAGDWIALRPLLEKLFQLERTANNARRLVESMQRDRKSGYASIVTFFKENPDVADWHDDFKSARAWALFYMGQSREARRINDQLLNSRNNPADLQLDINLAIQSGDWERFPAIVDREWTRRDTYDANILLRLASLAAEADRTASRAYEFAKLAASKAPNDPSVLMNAYSLIVQIGRDQDVDPSWMARAVELSSDSGPVHRVDFRTLVQEMMPAHRERERLIERNLLRGEVPLHLAAGFLDMPMSRILIDLPRRNAEQGDGRLRVIVPIASGARQIIGVLPSWVVGLDLTSLMVLGYLSLLRTILKALNRIVLAPETMLVLLNERRRVRFHQPSRIKNAEEIRELIDQSRLKPVKSSTEPPPWLVEEVGHDLAQMLQAARINNGRVVRPRPIYQLRTFLEKEADLKEYDNLILSTTALGRLLVEAGKLSRETYDQARQYLVTHDKGQEVDTLIASSIIGGPLFLDDLAVTYLQQAGLLQSVCRSGIDLWVHQSMREEQSALAAANREGERLNKEIDDIRSALCEALDKGKAVFLPRHDLEDEKIGSLSGFLADSGTCDIVCIDDRYMNRHGVLRDQKGRTVPIASTLDLVRYLEAQGLLDTKKKQAILHKLREAGFALMPVEPDELEQLLRSALFDQEDQLIESPELRIIRQTLMRIRSLDMIMFPLEAPYLARLRLACILSTRRLWEDNDLPVERTVALTDWVWKNIAPSPLDWERTAPSSQDSIPAREAYVRHLTLLLSPMGRVKGKRYKAFLNWIEQVVLEPLLPANDGVIDDLAKQIKIEIGKLVEELSDEN